MVKDTEVIPVNSNLDPQAPDSLTKEGQGTLPDWLTYSFITLIFSRAALRAVDLHTMTLGYTRLRVVLGILLMQKNISIVREIGESIGIRISSQLGIQALLCHEIFPALSIQIL
jgi:hypothetical protein